MKIFPTLLQCSLAVLLTQTVFSRPSLPPPQTPPPPGLNIDGGDILFFAVVIFIFYTSNRIMKRG
ncbi:hypothetical protein [Flavobacterium sp.]|uniref:hypothetical protein n=1 Tax=Flavobacterium sp. TaxID=239 RepID=UPI0039E241D3